MSSSTYKYGKVDKRIKKNITFTIPYFSGTTITGNNYVLTNDTNFFTINLASYRSVESITVTNCTYTYTSVTKTLTIKNVTGDVQVEIIIVGDTSELVFGSGSFIEGEPPHVVHQKVASGTVNYTDKYGRSAVMNIANAPSNKNVVLKNTSCRFANVKIENTTSYRTTKITFGQGSYKYNKHPSFQQGNDTVYTGSGSGCNYTFSNVTGRYVVADIQSAYGPE